MIKVNNEVVEIKRFPDGTLNIKGNPELEDEVVIAWHYDNDAEFMTLSFLTKYYQSHGCEVSLYLPYVPNARMDRIENPEDIFTLKYFGEMINSLNFKNVFVMDIHSSVTMAVIKNCVVISSNTLVEDVIHAISEDTLRNGRELIMFYPDEGAVKRYAKDFKIPYAFGVKKRDWNTGNILGLDILGLTEEEIKGKDILIRDDICSKGGTFYHSAKKLKELGANKIYLFVTHCENSIWLGEFDDKKSSLLETGLIESVFTTDSIYGYSGKFGFAPTHIFVAETNVDLNVEEEIEEECDCHCTRNCCCTDCFDDCK